MSSKYNPREDSAPSTVDGVNSPPQYEVIMHNDDFTPFDFVVQLLIIVFFKQAEEAIEIANAIHHKGAGIVGCYPLEIAETKVYKASAMARRNEFPLRCSIKRA